MKRLTLVIFAAGLFLSAPISSFSQWLNEPADEPKNENPEAAMKWFMEQRTFGLGYIPKDARLNALKQKEALRNKYFPNGKNISPESNLAEGSNVNWTNIGPFNIQGRVSAIVPHPTDVNIAWLGGAMGGIWKTTNAGNSWQPLSDNTYSLAMGGLAVDPANPNILYAGTGDAQANDYFGCGILKTIDGGKTWNPSGLGNVGAFSKLIVSPSNSNRVYAAGSGSGGGFYFSTDAGATWTKATGSFPFGEVTDISCAKNNGTDMIYAAMPGHGIYLSEDAGMTWNNVQDFNNGAPGQMRRLHVAVDPNNWKDVVALSVAYNSTLEALVRSTDGGTSWSDITNDIGAGVGDGDILRSQFSHTLIFKAGMMLILPAILRIRKKLSSAESLSGCQMMVEPPGPM